MTTKYHGKHDYSTFSASIISTQKINDNDINKAAHGSKFCSCLCKCKLSFNHLVLHPVGPFKCIWDMFVMVLLIYTSIEIPYTMAFGQISIIKYIGLFVDGFLFVDIILTFHTAYFDKYDNLRLVTNKRYICKKYFRGWFWIDFLTCIPFEIMFHDTENQQLTYIKLLRIFRLLRIVKILRFIKMLRIFDAFMKQFMVREFIVLMKIVKIIFGMLMFAHFAACLWWFVGTKTSPSWIDVKNLRDDTIPVFKCYSFSFYWAVITLFTTGYGDITATNTVEQWVCSASVLIGTVFFAYFIGTLTALITEGDKIKSYELEKLEEAQSFCEKKKLPKELTRAILTHIRYHCNYNYVFDETELLNMLPSYLQHDIHSYVSKQFLLSLPIFRNEFIQLPDFIIGLIAVNTKSISCNQHYKLYDCGDIAKELYIQRTGKSILKDKNNKITQRLCRGSVCGEYSSILFKKRQNQLECDTWSEFYSISVDDIKNILHVYYPKTATNKWRQIQKYVKYAYKSKKIHGVEFNNAYSGLLEAIDSPFSPSAGRSSSVFQNNTNSTNYEESVHLFDNTKNKKQFVINIQDLDSPPPVHPPPPLDSDESDADTCTETSNKTAKKKVSTLRKIGSKIQNKFLMRSDSGARDTIVIKHSQKHSKLTMPNLDSLAHSANGTEKKQNKDPKFGTYQSEPVNKLLASKLDVIAVQTPELKKKSSTMRSQYSAISNDSECSFLSISSDNESSFDDDNELLRACTDSKRENIGKNNVYNYNSKRNKKEKFRKRKKRKGKFGGQTRGTNGANTKHDIITPAATEEFNLTVSYGKPAMSRGLSELAGILAPLASGKEMKAEEFDVDVDGGIDIFDKHTQNTFFVNSNYDDESAESDTENGNKTDKIDNAKTLKFIPMNVTQPHKTC